MIRWVRLRRMIRLPRARAAHSKFPRFSFTRKAHHRAALIISTSFVPMSGVFGDSDLDTTADEKDTVGATPTKGGVDKDEWKVFITSTINKYPLAAVILTLYS